MIPHKWGSELDDLKFFKNTARKMFKCLNKRQKMTIKISKITL